MTRKSWTKTQICICSITVPNVKARYTSRQPDESGILTKYCLMVFTGGALGQHLFSLFIWTCHVSSRILWNFFFNKYHRTNVVVLLIYNSFFPGNVNIYYCWLLVTRRNSSILSTLDRLLTPYAAFCLYLLTPGIGFQLRVLCMVGKHCTIYILYPEYFVF